jgi:hypothetical protein
VYFGVPYTFNKTGYYLSKKKKKTGGLALAINHWFEAILITIHALFHQNTALGVTVNHASVYNIYDNFFLDETDFFKLLETNEWGYINKMLCKITCCVLSPFHFPC